MIIACRILILFITIITIIMIIGAVIVMSIAVINNHIVDGSMIRVFSSIVNSSIIMSKEFSARILDFNLQSQAQKCCFSSGQET